MTKFKKINSINLSSETLKAVSQILTDMDSVQVSFPHMQLRPLFELQFKNEGLNFTKLSEINFTYKDERVQAIYLSFKAAFIANTSAIQRALSKLNKSCVNSPYIIGMQVEDNTVQFGFRPFKHKTVHEVMEQAKVLADRHGKPYTVFGALDTIKPEGVKHVRQAMVSETRQGPSGRLKSYMVGVMQDLQALTKEVDISKEVFPSGIKFLPDGTFAVTFYNDDKVIVDRSMVGAVQIVEKHMNGFKQSKITTHPFEITNYTPS